MRTTLALCLLLTAAAPARAHFIWLVPESDKGAALMVFSDTLEPDANVPVKKIAHTKLFARGGVKGEALSVQVDEVKDAFRASVAKPVEGPLMIAGVCEYGVVSKGKDEPYLLMYYPKTILWPSPTKERPEWMFDGTDRLPLEIVPVFGGKQRRAKVLWHGKPAADVEVVLSVPGAKEPVELKTDQEGLFEAPEPMAAGVYAGRARFVEAKGGELGGKKYKEVRHYATMTFETRAGKKEAAAPGGVAALTALAGAGEPKLVEDPVATQLLAEARAARAVWKNFGGFTAEVTVNHDGAVHQGTVEVNAQGKVALALKAGQDLQTWARREIVSLVAHRLPGPTSPQTPCAFVDPKDQHHPLGRAVRVLNDELHSSYRIRDKRIIEVNRTTKEVRFTITVLEDLLNQEKQFLPVSYTVTSWDPKSGQIVSSAAYHQTWERVGPFDLPRSLLIVTATPTGRESRLITFSGYQLVKAAGG
jgi:uncharacterized GH25 family protein